MKSRKHLHHILIV